jgi:TPR repeat protein
VVQEGAKAGDADAMFELAAALAEGTDGADKDPPRGALNA